MSMVMEVSLVPVQLVSLAMAEGVDLVVQVYVISFYITYQRVYANIKYILVCLFVCLWRARGRWNRGIGFVSWPGS